MVLSSVPVVGLCAAWLLKVAQTSPNNSTGCSCPGHWPLGMHPAWSSWCYTVPARLPATLRLLAKPAVSVALAAVMYGSLNLISLLYLPLPILSFLSASLAASWQGFTARRSYSIHLYFLVWIWWLNPCYLTIFFFFLAGASQHSPALCCHLLTATLSLLRNPWSALSLVWAPPSSYAAFTVISSPCPRPLPPS